MTEEAKNRRKEYLRRWRKEHPEKNKQYISRYWEKKVLNKVGGNESD